MARKKKSQTDNSDRPEGTEEELTSPATETRDAPETNEIHSSDTTPEAAPARTESDDETDTDTGDTPERAATSDDTASDSLDDTMQPDTNTDQDDATTADETAPPAEEADAPPPTEHTEDSSSVMRTEQVTIRQGGFWSMLIGGIAAAGIGVAAAPYIYPHLPGGTATAPTEDGDSTLEARLDSQAQEISDLGTRIDNLPEPVNLSSEIGGLSETVTSLAERVANLEVRLSNLADRPAAETKDTGATDAALDDLRQSLAAQTLEIEELRSAIEAEEQAARDNARATLQRAALTHVMTALDTGEEFSAALSDLGNTGAPVPDVLAKAAKTGVPTRAQLASGFPAAARAALAAARTNEDGGGASVTAFLRAQLGVRSLEPREGDDPDAILSRAEAALAEGRLGDALAEIETLPENARAAMSGWTAEATARRDALAAAEALSAELN